jgi:uncharacterized membrane protein YdjX (TVP38/TMEM64 family)
MAAWHAARAATGATLIVAGGDRSRASSLAIALLGTAVMLWGLWSYSRRGLAFAIVATFSSDQQSIAVLREYVERAGWFGPVAYLIAVVVEVLIAPLPGMLLYAPGGALFGGFAGGGLSLAGNVIGATIACVLARVLGARLSARLEQGRLAQYVVRIRRRSLWLILLLRLNPLTSSDLVSYAAGFARVPVWHVTVGTLIGMAPLCFAQAYAAEQIFLRVPGSGVWLLAFGVAYAAVLLWLLARAPRRPTPPASGPPAESPSAGAAPRRTI